MPQTNYVHKLFEKVIYVRLYQHLIRHSVLVNEQSGLRAK